MPPAQRMIRLCIRREACLFGFWEPEECEAFALPAPTNGTVDDDFAARAVLVRHLRRDLVTLHPGVGGERAADRGTEWIMDGVVLRVWPNRSCRICGTGDGHGLYGRDGLEDCSPSPV